MKYPINYDFGTNWDTKIKPVLDNPILLTALKKGVDDYLSNYPRKRKYKKNTCPASYSSTDGYYMLMERKREELLEQLRKEKKLPKKFLKIEKRWKNNYEDEDYDDTIDQKYIDILEETLAPYFTWNKIKYNYESYWLHLSCHSYAPTFELTLARLVEPEEEWRVRAGEKHSTVINKNNTKVFDLLYWCLDGRIENHMFGDHISKPDKTLGGKTAFIYSK